MTGVVEQFESLVARAAHGAPIPLGGWEGVGAGGAIDPGTLSEAVKRLTLQDLPRALAVSEHLDRLDVPGPRERSRLLATRAHVLCYANRYEEAIALLGEAALRARESGCTHECGLVDLAAVQAHARLGHLAQAEAAARRAAAAFAAAADRVGEGKALLNLGVVLRMQDRSREALDALDRARALVGGDDFLRGAIASNRAEALRDLDRFAESEASFEEALACFDRAGNRHGAAIVEGNIADLLSREGRLDEAMERYESVRRRFEGAGAHADAARIVAEQAEVLGALGATDAAVRAYGEAIPRLEASGLRVDLARARAGLGLALLREGAPRDAVRTLEQALRELGEVGGEVLAGECAVALGVLRIGASPAVDERDAHAGIIERFRDRPLRQANARAEFARALLAAGRTEEARPLVEAVEAAAEAFRLVPLRARARHLRGSMLVRLGRTGEALAPLREAVAESDRLRGSLRAAQLRMAFAESWRQVYLDACSVGLRTGGAAGLGVAFDAIERLRSRSVLDALGASTRTDAGDHGAAPDEVRTRYEACVAELNVLYGRASADGTERAGAVERIGALENEAARLRERMEALRGDRTISQPPLSLDAAMSELPESAAVAVYIAEGDALHAIMLRRGGVEAILGLARISEVAGLLRRLRFVLDGLVGGAGSDAGAGGAWASLTSRLSELLLAPIAPRLDDMSTLGVSMPGELQGVPWAALSVGSSSILERCALVNVPSVSVSLRLAALRARHRPLRTLAVGVPDDAAPRMAEECLRVAQAAPHADALVGPLASAANVAARAPHADILHLAAHCVYSPWHPMSSRVRLFDRWMTARELVGLVRRGGAVVLAGCESGRQGGPGAEDRQGFVHALLASGASDVLAAHWPLHDGTVASMFPEIHRRAAGSRAGLGDDLQSVQLDALHAGVPAWWWAGLFVTGGMS